MVETIFSLKGKKKSVEVLAVDPRDCTFSTWWNNPAYFVATSEGEFVNCGSEEDCIERAKTEAAGE